MTTVIEHFLIKKKMWVWFHWHSAMSQRLKKLSFNFLLVTEFWCRKLLDLIIISTSIQNFKGVLFPKF